jgi:hypothetical protein
VRSFSRRARPRDGAALGFRFRGRPLAALHQVTTILVYDEAVGSGRTMVHLTGYRPQVTPAGVDWTAEVAFQKTLTLTPRPFARGERIDSRWQGLLELGLRLDQRLQQAQRHPERLRRTPLRWPRLWAAFSPATAAKVQGQSPSPGSGLIRGRGLTPCGRLRPVRANSAISRMFG